MSKQKKILGEERRQLILKWLMESNEPITGNELATKTNVSRQVIVQDISILKAREHQIFPTSQGYMYLKPKTASVVRQVIACQHGPKDTKEELMIFVEHGVTVLDVIVEHQVYGELTASLRVSNRQEVENFINKISETNASFLSELTEGTHLHTVEAESHKQIDDACRKLKERGFLLSSS